MPTLRALFRNGMRYYLDVNFPNYHIRWPLFNNYKELIQEAVDNNALRDEGSVWWLLTHKGIDPLYEESTVTITLGEIYKEALIDKHGDVKKALRYMKENDNKVISRRSLQQFFNNYSLPSEEMLNKLAVFLEHKDAIDLITKTLEFIVQRNLDEESIHRKNLESYRANSAKKE